MVSVDPGDVEHPGKGMGDSLVSPQGARMTGTVIYPSLRSSGLGGVAVLRRPNRFTNTAVPRFDRTVCWQQHQQMFNAIAKSKRMG